MNINNKIINFLSKHNIIMLWDIIIQNNLVKDKKQIHIVEEYFNKLVYEFYETEKINNISLIIMNKNFIVFFITKLNTFYNSLSYQQPNTIASQEKKQNITFEDIQREKKELFDIELQRKTQEFNDSMALSVPPIPNFSDNIQEEPLNTIMTTKVIQNIKEMRQNDEKIFTQNSNKQITTNEMGILNEKKHKRITIEEPIINNQIKKEIIDLNDYKRTYDEYIPSSQKPNINLIIQEKINEKQQDFVQDQYKYYILEEKINNLTDKVNNLTDKVNTYMEKIDVRLSQILLLLTANNNNENL
jgi:ATP-dependent Lon protease